MDCRSRYQRDKPRQSDCSKGTRSHPADSRTYEPWAHFRHAVLGGYQVLKKWLSDREAKVLERPLNVDEIETFTHNARRIAALLALGEARDANYRRVTAETVLVQ